MKTPVFYRDTLIKAGVEGALITLAPLPIMLAGLHAADNSPALWRIGVAAGAGASWLACGLVLFRRPKTGRLLGFAALAAGVVISIPYLGVNPFAALLGAVAIISAGYALGDASGISDHERRRQHADYRRQRAWWSVLAVLTLDGLLTVSGKDPHLICQAAVAVSGVIGQLLFLRWAWTRRPKKLRIVPTISAVSFVATLLLSLQTGHIQSAVLIAGLVTIFILSGSRLISEQPERWWEALFNHPARMLLITFLLLCVSGTFLLKLPNAAGPDGISVIDAAFTSVSAVCVTGLIVLDTPGDFALLGQFFIMLLIQFGGLGIMSITTVALHAMGRRLSLRQERLMATMTDTDRNNLISSLLIILKFTFVAEGLGALILSGLFHFYGDSFWQAAWRGVFTAVSAFCNAGFALQSNSLIPYQENPLVLHSVAALIVLGGMSPATSLILPKWIAGKSVPVAARIALMTSAILLISGTFFLLLFEWNGVLSGLSVADKIHNAWFQSVTLRTAGFNSADITGIAGPSFLLMICFMFVGGSPGGTAGGVKTTTIGILAMTFWANIAGRSDVVVQNRRIPAGTIHRAVTIIVSGVLVWWGIVLMLEVTQQIPVRDVIFEVTSALGTVGLSTGATASLDEIGKVIIMMAMFLGRIGPVTLFMLLSENPRKRASRCPTAKISLT